MKYSVIIPCYNTSSTVEKTVMSISSSGLADFEILLIDDGSKDNTPVLCDRLAAEYGNIRAIHQPNAGVSSARNRGIKEAQGEYIWFFDSDDVVDEGSMNRAMRIIEEQKPDMLMFGMSFDYYTGKRLYQRLELYYDEERLMTPAQVQETFLELYHNNMLTPCWNKLFRKAILENHQIRFNTDLFVMEDFLFSLQVVQHCNSIYTLPQAVYRYNLRDGVEAERSAKRLKRISNLAEYLKPFESELFEHPDILTSMYFMLLRQTLSIQKPSEMAETAKIVCNSEYVCGKYAPFCDKVDQALVRQLKNGKFQELYLRNKKTKVRQVLVGIIKRSSVYSLLKSSSVQK